MAPNLWDDGYEIHREVIGKEPLMVLRQKAEQVAQRAGSACVRHLRAHSACFDALAFSENLSSLLPRGFSPVRSILFDKTPAENWPVFWHQDLTIAVAEEIPVCGYGPWSRKEGAPHVQPPLHLLESMITIRLHLDDTPAANGALRVIPGSHRKGKIPGEAVAEYATASQSVFCEYQAGDVLLMSPLLLHSSQRSASPFRRRVVHFEYARREDLHPDLKWFESDSRSKS
jgi:Phytanoyl-CoA dioxygenase (PhyH)